jgi:hypothetical protein
MSRALPRRRSDVEGESLIGLRSRLVDEGVGMGACVGMKPLLQGDVDLILLRG